MKIHRIPVGPFATNCVLVEDEATREALIVDPGADRARIAERLRTLGLKPVMVVHTHGHVDHCLESSALAREHGIPIAMHADDVELFRHLRRQVEVLMGPAAARMLGAEDTVEPAVLLREGDVVRVGGLEGRVLHLPGHSPGGIGLLFPGTPQVLVVGDTIFRDGVGRSDLWGGDWDTLLGSIRRKVFTLPDDTRLVTGHGAETTVGREKAGFAY